MGLKILGFHVQPPQLIDRQEDFWYSLWRCSVAEFFGTAIFVFLGTGAVDAGLEALGGVNSDISVSFIILVAMAHGFAITLTIYTIGDVSGGNINPAVTWALVLTRKMSVVRGILYVVFQCLGAISGSFILKSTIPAEYQNNLGCHGLNAKMTPVEGMWFEIVLTFIFVFVVFGTAVSPFVGKMAPVSGGGDQYGPGKLTPLALGLTILTLHCVGVSFTGASMNPARSLGPAVIGACWKDFWIYWVGPLIGSTIAALVAHILFLSNPANIAKSLAILRGNKELENLNKKNGKESEDYSHVQENEENEMEMEQ